MPKLTALAVLSCLLFAAPAFAQPDLSISSFFCSAPKPDHRRRNHVYGDRSQQRDGSRGFFRRRDRRRRRRSWRRPDLWREKPRTLAQPTTSRGPSR